MRVIGQHELATWLHVTCYIALQRDRLTDKLKTILRAAAIACGRSNYYVFLVAEIFELQ